MQNNLITLLDYLTTPNVDLTIQKLFSVSLIENSFVDDEIDNAYNVFYTGKFSKIRVHGTINGTMEY